MFPSSCAEDHRLDLGEPGRRSEGDKSEVNGSEVLVRKLKNRKEGRMG
jgi:hypothetical protein